MSTVSLAVYIVWEKTEEEMLISSPGNWIISDKDARRINRRNKATDSNLWIALEIANDAVRDAMHVLPEAAGFDAIRFEFNDLVHVNIAMPEKRPISGKVRISMTLINDSKEADTLGHELAKVIKEQMDITLERVH